MNFITQPLVSIACITYNHEPYIRQCLDGFVMQKTNFQFEIVIHDDASTDNTKKIIQEYCQRYPGLFRPIFQDINRYKEGKGILARFVFPECRGKYIAMCEGDDYWTDPLKLQKQVDFLEGNSEYVMTCSDALILSKDGELDWCRYLDDTDIPVEDMIINGGLFVQTASLLFHKSLLDEYPEFCKQCKVGDYPLQIWASLRGKVRWFAEKQVVYRFAIGNSWSSGDVCLNLDDTKISERRSIITMLREFDKLSDFKYHNTFRRRQVLYRFLLLERYPKSYRLVSENFSDVKSMYTIKEHIHEMFILLGVQKYYYAMRNLLSRLPRR